MRRQTRSRSRSSASSAQQAPDPSPSGRSSLANSSDESSLEDTRSPRGTRQRRPDRTNTGGLSTSVQKQLLSDIEGAGGLHSTFSLRLLCDSKQDIYGTPSSSKRKSVQNKVTVWRRLPLDEYYHLLATHGVQPSTGNPPAASPPRSRVSCSSQSSSSSELDSSSSSSAKSSPTTTTTRTPERSFLPSPVARNMERNNTVHPDDVDLVINVNTVFPERNILFLVAPFTDVEDSNGDLINGYEIVFNGDFGDYIADNYKAKLLNENEVLIELPCVSKSYVRGFNDAFDRLKVNTDPRYCSRSEQVHKVFRRQIAGDGSRNTQNILLKFPSGTQLTSDYFANKINGELECEILPFRYDHEAGDDKVPRWIDMIQWRVALHENPRRNNRDVPSNESTSKGMAKVMSTMNRVATISASVAVAAPAMSQRGASTHGSSLATAVAADNIGAINMMIDTGCDANATTAVKRSIQESKASTIQDNKAFVANYQPIQP